MNKKIIDKNIELSYQLTNYLITHPNRGFGDNFGENIIIFTQNDKEFNRANVKILMKLIEQYKKVTVALIDSKGNKDYWSFDIASKNNIPSIPFL